MIVYELKDYPLLPITPDTELEDYSGGGCRYYPKFKSRIARFSIINEHYYFNGCIDFAVGKIYTTQRRHPNEFDILKRRICIFAPGKLTRLRIVE
jgi:hypothetical protein